MALARSLDNSQLVLPGSDIRCGVGIAGDRYRLRQLLQKGRDLAQQITRAVVRHGGSGREHRRFDLVHDLDAQSLRRHVDGKLFGELRQFRIAMHRRADVVGGLLERDLLLTVLLGGDFGLGWLTVAIRRGPGKPRR